MNSRQSPRLAQGASTGNKTKDELPMPQGRNAQNPVQRAERVQARAAVCGGNATRLSRRPCNGALQGRSDEPTPFGYQSTEGENFHPSRQTRPSNEPCNRTRRNPQFAAFGGIEKTSSSPVKSSQFPCFQEFRMEPAARVELATY